MILVRNFEGLSKRDPGFRELYLGIQVMLIPEEQHREIKIRRSLINKRSQVGVEQINNLSLLNESECKGN